MSKLILLKDGKQPATVKDSLTTASILDGLNAAESGRKGV